MALVLSWADVRRLADWTWVVATQGSRNRSTSCFRTALRRRPALRHQTEGSRRSVVARDCLIRFKNEYKSVESLAAFDPMMGGTRSLNNKVKPYLDRHRIVDSRGHVPQTHAQRAAFPPTRRLPHCTVPHLGRPHTLQLAHSRVRVYILMA